MENFNLTSVVDNVISEGVPSSTAEEIIAESRNCTIHEVMNDVDFVFNGVGITLLALFGIPANILNMIVLKHPKMKSSLTTLLLGLTISDMFVIITSCFIYTFTAIFEYVNIFPWYNETLYPNYLPWVFPILVIAHMSSVYFTVVVTLERYIAVCLPLRACFICTQTSARNSSIGVIILSILYNMPRWFEIKTVSETDSNGTTKYSNDATDMRKNDDYILYYRNLSYPLVVFFIPFSILLFFNFAIFWEVKKQRRYRNSLSPTIQNASTSNNSEDLALAGMLFGIVITFFACNTLFLVTTVMDIFDVCYFESLISIGNFLIIFCCSANFIFYCLFGNKFRSQLARTLGMNKLSKKDSRDNSSDDNFRMHSNVPTAMKSNSVTSINSNGNSPPRNQRSSNTHVTDNNPNTIENQKDEISSSQVTGATCLGD